MTDLTYLNEIDNAIFRPDAPIAVERLLRQRHGVEERQSDLGAPAKLPDGSISDMPVLTAFSPTWSARNRNRRPS